MTEDERAVERKAFEEWVEDYCGPGAAGLYISGQPQCGYANSRVQDYWDGWKARADRAGQVAAAAACYAVCTTDLMADLNVAMSAFYSERA